MSERGFGLAPIKREGTRVCDCCYELVGTPHTSSCAYAAPKDWDGPADSWRRIVGGRRDETSEA